MARDFPILQVVGYQNSGKTTFVEMLLEKLEHDGVQAGCLKHHGHGESRMLLPKEKIPAVFAGWCSGFRGGRRRCFPAYRPRELDAGKADFRIQPPVDRLPAD